MNMMNKKKYSIIPYYRVDENQKGTLYYISFKFLCLCLYIIGFYYVLLNNSLENGSLEIAKNCNIYKRNLVQVEKDKGSKRKKNLKLKKEDVNKTKYNENNIKSNEQEVEENKQSINNDCENRNAENESNISTCNINYNDMSKNLTETELREVLNSFKDCPPKEDLRNIWNHTLKVAKEGFDIILKELKESIQKYLDNDIDLGNEKFLYKDMWNEIVWNFCRAVANEELEYLHDFSRLINCKYTLDDILKFIYSFLEHFETLKKELHEKYKKELSQKIKKSANTKKY